MKWHHGHHHNEARPMVVKGGEKKNSSVVSSPIQSYKCYILWYYVFLQHIADLNVDVNMLESKILTQRASFTAHCLTPALVQEGMRNIGCLWKWRFQHLNEKHGVPLKLDCWTFAFCDHLLGLDLLLRHQWGGNVFEVMNAEQSIRFKTFNVGIFYLWAV